MTERQRRALLKRRPQVESWRALFEADRMREEPPAPSVIALRSEACRPRRATRTQFGGCRSREFPAHPGAPPDESKSTALQKVFA
jgi:hypothetical protein